VDSLTIVLSAALINHYATSESQTKVETSLINNTGWITVEDIPGSPRSTHRFIVHDAEDLGYPIITKEQAEEVMAISCSLITPKVLFSPLQLQRLGSTLYTGSDPDRVNISKTNAVTNIAIRSTVRIGGSLSTTSIEKKEIDAAKLSEVIKRLLNIHLFDYENRPILEKNILDGIISYNEALCAGEPIGCYMALFKSLEKTINSSVEKMNDKFDAEVAVISGLSKSDCTDIREFNNRTKHTIRREKDHETFKNGKSNFPHLIVNLKSAVDSSLLSKI
jgi:hypothetical protein